MGTVFKCSQLLNKQRSRSGRKICEPDFYYKEIAADKLQVYQTFLDGRWILTVKIVWFLTVCHFSDLMSSEEAM